MRNYFELSSLSQRTRLVLGVLLGLAGAVALGHSGVLADPPAAPQPVAAVPIKPVQAQTPTQAQAPAQAPSDQAHIVFTTVPPAYANVTWGKKLLGRIAPRQPLVVVRPRDSGPLDVMVRAPGFLPVQVRAHTFSDSRVTVKLTTPEQKNTLLGYRQPIDAGPPDAGEFGPPPTEPATAPLP
jgi:hypothetical protein